jgi:predicted permease
MPSFNRLFARRRRYDDLSVSIQEHLRERTEELIEAGMSRPDAERTARREFGNVTLISERSREQWQFPLLESVLADLRLVFRRLFKTPGFTAAVLLTLAIGIGANTAVFTVIDSVLLKPLPYPESGRLVALWLNASGASGLANFSNGLQLSESMYLTFADHNRSFQSVGVWFSGTANVTGAGQPEQAKITAISSGVLESLEVPALAGRWLNAADQDPKAARNVVLSYGYWQRKFGGDPHVLGRSVQVDSQTGTIVGVMPRGFRIVDRDFDLLVPLAPDRAHQKLAGFGLYAVARLKPGVSIAQADGDIARMIPVWMDSWTNGPGTNPHYYEVWHITPNLRPLKQQVVGDVSRVLWVVMGTVGIVMLVACTNVANLLLIRAESRLQELTIRAALGAGRARIARELLVESTALGLLGGAAGLVTAYGGLRLLLAYGPANLPRMTEVMLDARSLAFTVLLSVGSGLFFGLIPVLRYARERGLALTGSGRTASAGVARQRSRNVLVVAQVAMALVLLICAVLMIRTFVALRHVEPGFGDAEHVETVRVWIPPLLSPDVKRVAQMQKEIADKFSAIPGTSSVGFASGVPMDGNDPNWDLIEVEGKHYEGGEPPLRLYNYVSPEYFSTMKTRFVAGRDFTWPDQEGIRPMIVVSESFARENWGSAAAAVGKRVRKYSKSPWQEVIGVVEDVHMHGVDESAPPIVYWPAMFYDRFVPDPQMDGLRTVTFVLRTARAGTSGFAENMQQAVWQINPSLPLANIQTMQETYGRSLARASFTLTMLAIAGVMALALSLIGMYGVISYSVLQRTREIGIRVAMGAQKQELRWMFVRSALVLTGVGIVIGAVGAAGVTQFMRLLLYGVSPLDPLTFLAIPLVLAGSAVLASYLPACRAAGVNPVTALRSE